MPDTIISQFERTYGRPIETYRQVASISARDSIPTTVRWEGMQVYVVADNTTYELRGGIGNSNFVDLGDVIGVVVEDNVTSNVTTNALSANQGRLLDEKFDNYLTTSGGTLSGGLTISAGPLNLNFGSINVSSGGLTCSGTVTCFDLIETSDLKAKKNITSLAFKPEPIKVNWVSFEYKAKEHKGIKRYGVIANELEQHHPEFVVHEGKYKAVRYLDLHSAKLAELERRIEILESHASKPPPRYSTRII